LRVLCVPRFLRDSGGHAYISTYIAFRWINHLGRQDPAVKRRDFANSAPSRQKAAGCRIQRST
jgi:hypothetical protein